MLRNRYAIVSLGVLALLAAYVIVFPPQSVPGTRLSTCPMTLAGLPGTEIGLEQTVLDDLDPDDYLVRRYDRPGGEPVWVVVVYFQNARLGAHDPQLCYRSQGFRVRDLPDGRETTSIGEVPYKSFLAEKGPRKEVVRYFWYTAGGRALAEVKAWRDQMFFQGLRNNRSFGAFVRVSTMTAGGPDEADDVVSRVIADLAARLPELFPEDEPPREDGRG